MGFPLNLLVARPSRDASQEYPYAPVDLSGKECGPCVPPLEKKYTVWSVSEIISFGRITRPQKMVGRGYEHLHASYTGRIAAAIGVTGALLPPLFRMLQNPSRAHFAPEFGLMDDGPYAVDPFCYLSRWHEQHLSYERISEDAQFCRARTFLGRISVPVREHIQDHNRKILLPDEAFFGEVSDRWDPILQMPLVWTEASAVLRWIRNWSSGSDINRRSWQRVRTDEEALSYLRMWRAVLTEAARLNAKVIFYFEHLPGSGDPEDLI